jgi:hypothetical protein
VSHPEVPGVEREIKSASKFGEVEEEMATGKRTGWEI